MSQQNTVEQDLVRSMLSRAAHLPAFGSQTITEHINGVCVQCVGRPTYRRTRDGLQPTISFHWFIECRRSSKAKALAAIRAARSSEVGQQ